ncbi:hypothetical protein JIN84_21825 [Luteolibacter yonseiensis]|uniref:Lipoprotein n=1 Tax=Luteolibacter yonseiensis TaxID=1144680 RepID=A0A934R6P0_9BACT|nr:hypothetical protein [Luteolibacter yonseiensis]MBK1818276.1 hypothetical protein [Luteolibacter yonseiensis]
MRTIIRILLLAFTLSLTACEEEQTSREEARVQQEVARRVEAIRTEMKTAEARWRTLRIGTLSLLAGGSLILLLGGYADKPGKTTSARLPAGDHPVRRRVIDHPYDDLDDEYENHPHRR